MTATGELTSTGEQRPTRSPRPGLRLTRRGRVSVAVVLLGALLATLLAAFWLGTWRASVAATTGVGTGVGSGPAYETIVLREGQTLWDIATRRVPGADPRITVYRIMELNQLSGAAVQTGQRIRVPATG